MTPMKVAPHRVAAVSLALLLVACQKSPENAAAPAPASAAAPTAASTPGSAAITAPVAASAAVPAAASAPAATTAAAAGTTAVPAAASDNGPEVAGSVALAQGSVTDTAKDGSVRQLKDGDDVYPGDAFVVGPDSYLDLDLEDTGRMLLRPNTTFQIESYHFEPEAHAETAPTDASGQPLIKPQQPENAFFRLVKGGLRAIDGLIGHSTPQNYGVETPVATIGVRGTAFDVRYCGDDCGDEADAAGSPQNGLYTSVTDGTVDVKNDDGDVVTPAGHSGFVKSRKQRMQVLATPPRALRHMALPDKFKARAEKNRGQIKLRRQQRRQRMLERRRQAAQRARATGKPAAVGKPETRQERREQRREQKQGRAGQKPLGQPSDEQLKQTQKRGRVLRRQEHEQERRQAAPGPGKPAAAGRAPAQSQEWTPRERRHQMRQQQHEQKQVGRPANAPDAKPAQQPEGKQDKRDEARCKAKRRRQKDKDKDQNKDKDRCGGD